MKAVEFITKGRRRVAEGSLNEFAPGGNSASSYYAVTANFVNEFTQQKQEQLRDLIDAGWTRQDLAQSGQEQGAAADIAHFEQVRDGFLKGLKPGFDAYLRGDTQMKDQLGAYWMENDLPLNQDWEKIYGEPWGDDSEFNEGMAEGEPTRLKLDNNNAAQAWIEKVYTKYPTMWQNNHVMLWGEGDNQQFAMFELVPSFRKRGAVEVKWFQAYPLRQGVGSKAMKELQQLAKEDNITLTLYPWDKGQVSQNKLTKFYKSQGFAPTVKGSKSMAWSPNKITEAAGTNILVVDVQPAHDSLAGGVVGGVAGLLNKSTGTIYMLYNANGYTNDTKYDVVSYFIDNGLDQQVAQRIKYIEKEYGFFRAWMDQGVPDRIIIKTIRAMVQRKVNDSRMLDIDSVLTPQEQQEFQSKFRYSSWEDEGIYMPDFMPISILKQISPFYMCGGGRNECLREIELLCNAFNIRYKRLDQLIYG